MQNPEVTQYIKDSASFAQPILKHLRKLVHHVCPEAVETIKWGMPHFEYKGAFCGMAAFKAHCALFFQKSSLMKDAKVLTEKRKDGMGNLGRITSLKDLPADSKLIAYIKEAVALNEKGVKKPSRTSATERKPLEIPKEFAVAMKRNKAAQSTFKEFSYTNQKDYVEWIAEAKTETTRDRRIEQAIEWLAEGKRRNWKYENR